VLAASILEELSPHARVATAILPLAAVGLIAQWFLPVVLVLDVLAALFFRALWRHYRPTPATAAPPLAAPPRPIGP